MRISYILAVLSAFVLAAILSLVAARFSVMAVEDATEIGLRHAFDDSALQWAEVEADGLRVILAGTAPTEAERLRALSVAGGVVDATRIVNEMDVVPTADLSPPRFSVEILRNDAGISIIGLIPASTDRAALIERLREVAGPDRVADLLQTADYTPPEGWEDALAFSVIALSKLPRAKISASAGGVTVNAMTDSAEQRDALERDLNRAAPPGLRLALDISAPRPIITPFTLRFVIDDEGARFDACAADSERSRDRIIAAAERAGLTGSATCTVAMGMPAPSWVPTAEQAIAALAELGGGSVTLADTDISLVAKRGTDPQLFDKVVGELESHLPEIFALKATLPEPETSGNAAAPEFTATLSPEGLVQIRGRLNNDRLRKLVDSLAQARFGSGHVHIAARVAEDLPDDWPVRVLAGVEALSLLRNGYLSVQPDKLTLHGVTEHEEATDAVARLLADKLGENAVFDLKIAFQPPPEPEDAAPDPETCIAQLQEAQKTQKITFEPGSATMTAESLPTMNAIADILDKCGEIRLEIQGRTDSQGREEMNLQLSQARAQSVLNELRARRVLTSTYVAKGYGESRPIADNKTEEGREANRRIEFHLLRPEPSVEGEPSDATKSSDTDQAPDAKNPGPQEPDTQAPAPQETE